MISATTTKRSIRRAIHDQLDAERSAKKGLSATNWGLVFVILLSLVLYTAETEHELLAGQDDAFRLLNVVILCIFCFEFVLRLWAAGVEEKYEGTRGLVAYVKANWFMVLVDFLAFGPELIVLAVGGVPWSWLRSFRVARLLKMARYLPAFKLVVDALRACIQELMVALSLSAVLWYVAAVLLYLAESEAQPEQFGSITRSMWWSVVTLTTVGYGDAYPVTVLGMVAAGGIAVVGVGTLALPSGIIAGAFIEKFRERREKCG